MKKAVIFVTNGPILIRRLIFNNPYKANKNCCIGLSGLLSILDVESPKSKSLSILVFVWHLFFLIQIVVFLIRLNSFMVGRFEQLTEF